MEDSSKQFPMQLNAEALSMSSREIADLCQKQHNHVLRDIRAYVGAILQMERGIDVRSLDWSGKEGVELFGQTPIGGVLCSLETNLQNGQSYPIYHLDKSATLTVVSGYSVLLRKRIIDRWMELEGAHQAATTPNLNDPTLLRGLLLENVEKVIALQEKVDELQSSADALDQIAEAHGSLARTDAAKHLGVPPHVLIKWMKTNGWTYRRAGTKEDLAYQSKINSGYLEHKITTGPRPDGTEWISTQVRVTPKGLTVLAKAFPSSARAA